MPKQNFVDYVKIHAIAGHGGAGSAHLRREKYEAFGGPDGGNGGRGGHIILKGNRNLWTLLKFKFRMHIRADKGGNGSGSQSSGLQGEDIVLEVPLGTIIRDGDTGEFLFEMTAHDEEHFLVKGGRGGLGNVNFKSSTNQTPRYAQPGEEGEEGWRILELKVLADVGLVGFPNAGKSTLLSVLTAAKPEIGAYPFTTITPNLGIVKYRDDQSFGIADIPGIIKNAHLGKGLGHRFLRHIERNATLLFCIQSDADSIREQYMVLLNELAQYNPELIDKPRVIAITKADLVDDELKEMLDPEIPKDVPHLYISAVTGEGIVELKDILFKMVTDNRDGTDERGSMEEE